MGMMGVRHYTVKKVFTEVEVEGFETITTVPEL